jgi:PAS domain S-box-containing protein
MSSPFSDELEHLRLIVDAAPSAILLVDEQGKISSVNAQSERLFGYGRDELLGRPVEILVPEASRGAHPTLRARYQTADGTVRPMGAGRELFARRKDGSHVPVEIGLNPVSTPHGKFVLAAIIDITERKRAEELRLLSVREQRRRRDAEEERDRALDASYLKSQFVATMSHELRTPLNAIIGAAELLNATQMEERQRFYVTKIADSADALLSIINGILEFSKIEAGKVELDDELIDLEKIVVSAADVLAQQARQKGIVLNTFVDLRSPVSLRGDAGRLRQILVNLIGNAVKFTERGSVLVRALPAEITNEEAIVRFEVQDTGIGISEQVLPKLFAPFVQSDGSSSRRFGGTGLGLSISKRLVELMGGEMGVLSTLGAGSLFWFTVRFLLAHEQPRERTMPGVTAMLYSGDDVFAQIVAQYLEAWGMYCRRVRDAAELIAMLRSSDSGARSLAIVDVGDAGGVETCAILRASGVEHRVIAVGDDGPLAKPLYPSRLFDHVVELLEMGDVSLAVDVDRSVAACARRTSARVLIAEDNRGMHELLNLQFDELGLSVEIVADGAQAVAAAQRERFAAIFMDCHMPIVDGFEATRMIREAELASGEHVPIIAMTANAFKEDREECLAVGMDDHLAKPVRMEALRAVVERWVAI